MFSDEGKRDNENKIREIISMWAESIRFDRSDMILQRHAPDALIFDVLPPLQYEGSDAYKASWEQGQPSFAIPSVFNVHDLSMTVGDGVAFAHCLIQCGGTLENGDVIDNWVRATFGFKEINSKWMICHQHISMPIE